MVKVSLGYKRWMEYYPNGTIVFCDDVTLVRKIFTPSMYDDPEELQRIKVMTVATQYAAEQVAMSHDRSPKYAIQA